MFIFLAILGVVMFILGIAMVFVSLKNNSRIWILFVAIAIFGAILSLFAEKGDRMATPHVLVMKDGRVFEDITGSINLWTSFSNPEEEIVEGQWNGKTIQVKRTEIESVMTIDQYRKQLEYESLPSITISE